MFRYGYKVQQRAEKAGFVAVILFLLSACMQTLRAQSATQTVDSLVNMGYENVSWHENEEERIYVLENVASRLSTTGISEAVGMITRKGLPEHKTCRIVFLDNNIPQLSLVYRPVVADSLIGKPVVTPEWKTTADVGTGWRQAVRSGVRNSSLFKVDLVIYPELMLKNLVITQIYQVLFNLSPAIEISLWKGMKLTAQMVFPVYNDGYGTRLGKIHPGFLAAQQTVRLPYNIWTTLAVGAFNNERYGADLRVRHTLIWDERFSLEGRIGLTATYRWDGFSCSYGTARRLTWSLGAGFYWPRYNVQTTLKAEQYLLGEKGARLDIIRHFKHASVGFYAMKAQGARVNGGFRIQVALPPYRYKRRGYIPRVLPSKNMGIAYNAGNERFYYQNYRVSPADNMMQENAYNPYFINSYLLTNFNY